MNSPLKEHPLNALINEYIHVATPPYAMMALLKLESADYSVHPANGLESLTFKFTGPSEPFVPQGSYFFLHKDLEPQLIFLVPRSQTADGFCYEACFTRIPSHLTAAPHKEQSCLSHS